MKILRIFVMLAIIEAYGLRINISSRQAAIKFQQNIVKAIRKKAVTSRQQKKTSLMSKNTSTVQKTKKPDPLISYQMQFTSTKSILKTKKPVVGSHSTFKPFLPRRFIKSDKFSNKPAPASTSRKKTSQTKTSRYFQQKATVAKAIAAFGQNVPKQYETSSTPKTAATKIRPNLNDKIKGHSTNNSFLIALPKKQTEFVDLIKNNVSDNILQFSLAANLNDSLAKSIFSKLHDSESIWERAEKLEYTPPGYDHVNPPQFLWPMEVNLTRTKSGRRNLYKTIDKTAAGQKAHMLEIMRDIIYDSQDRMKALNQILRKQDSNVRFQVGYTFTVMNSLVYDMRRLWTNLRRNYYWAIYRGQANKMPMHTARVSRNIIYYTHVFAKYIDVVYIVEQVCAKYEQHVQQKRKIADIFKGRAVIDNATESL